MAIYEVGSMIAPILQRKKLKLREMTWGKQTQMCIPTFCPFLPTGLHSPQSEPYFFLLTTQAKISPSPDMEISALSF